MTASQGISSYKVEQAVAVLTIDSPPVNALSHKVRLALAEGVGRALADESAEALVIICGGRTFFAGADVTEIGKPMLSPLLADVMALFEASTKPIVTAMHGTALGGGLEISLAAHYRVAVPSAVVGLPEVALGLLPGAGGTQRTPRLVGVVAAVDMMAHGRHVKASEAVRIGLIDALVEEGQLEAGAIAFARNLVATGAPLRLARNLSTDLDMAAAQPIFDQFRRDNPNLFVGVKSPASVLKAIEAAITLPFDQGIVRERELAQALTASPESAAQRHLFFAERAAAKLPGADKEKPPVVTGVAVQGSWVEADALAKAGLGGNPDILIRGADDTSPLAEAQAPVIVLTHNLDRLDALAAEAALPHTVVGLSVHSGVWEIVVGAQTAPQAALAVLALARKLGRSAIFVKPAALLPLARLQARFANTLAELQAEGVAAGDLAATARNFGWAAGLLPKGDGTADPTIEERLLAPALAEARAIIAEGIVSRSSDLDYAMVKAGLWPLWRGGPAFMADRAG